ncbi:MAG: ABC transporter substrate-binding protein [Fusobacteriaceae bacterium]|jgi:peptide/nickel transport system substrate-binding protein|nr:ABC transporter substrate-binding protein [Fusobacteriaceae bacterium]
MKRQLKVKLMALLLLVFCGVLQAAGELVIAQQADARSLDPSFSNDVYSHNVNVNIYDRLVDWSPTMTPENSLAESFKQLDPLTLQVKIKEGVKFHNGDELTSEDVKFTIERSSKVPAAKTYYGDVDHVDIVDKYTVNIVTKIPYGPIMNTLAQTSGSILNKKYVEANGDKAFQQPVGTGPFKFKSWQSGDRIILDANKDYFRGAPGTTGVIFRVIPESTNRTIALETKEIDMALVIDPVDAATVRSRDYLKLHEMPSLSFTYLGYNCKKAPLDDARVRKAIALGINLPDIVDTAFQKAAVPAYSVIAEATLAYKKDLPRPKRDVEAAKALLKEAGFEKGLKLKLWLNENQSRKDSAVIIQAQLAEIGIDVTIEILEWGAYLTRLSNAEHELFLLGWSGSPDPDGGMYALFNSKNFGEGGNNSFYKNDRVDELLDKGRATTDAAARIPLYEEAQEILIEEQAVCPLVNPINMVGAQASLTGFDMNPRSVYFFRNIKKAK